MKYFFKSLEEIKEEAIAFRKYYPVRYFASIPGTIEYWAPDSAFLSRWDKCYSVNNGIVSFVQGDTVYVVPSITNVIEILRGIELEETNIVAKEENKFFVPLSNGEKLENYELQEHWSFLKSLKAETER